MQNVFITGANRGIGLEFVRQYAYRGDHVFAGVRDPDHAAELHSLCTQFSNQINLIRIDVADQPTVDAAAITVRSMTPVLDVLINNAGIYLRGDRPGTLNRGQFRETFEVNVIGPAMIIQSFLPLLRAGSRVVNISSNMGSLANPAGGSYNYRISKTAVNKLSRILSADLAVQQITVIAMNPGGCIRIWVAKEPRSPSKSL